jgi:hypothetical protein
MNNEKSSTYYALRTFVRIIVWGLATSVVVVLATSLITSGSKETKPTCDVSLNVNFTWDWNSPAIPLTNCLAPEGVVINVDGSWGWFNPDL